MPFRLHSTQAAAQEGMETGHKTYSYSIWGLLRNNYRHCSVYNSFENMDRFGSLLTSARRPALIYVAPQLLANGAGKPSEG